MGVKRATHLFLIRGQLWRNSAASSFTRKSSAVAVPAVCHEAPFPLSFRHELYERITISFWGGGSWGRHEPDKTDADDLMGHCVEVSYIRRDSDGGSGWGEAPLTVGLKVVL